MTNHGEKCGICSPIKLFGSLVFIVVFVVCGFAQKFPCLPSDIKEESVVRVIRTPSVNGPATVRKVTVKQALKSIKAKCNAGRLVDLKGRLVKFYAVQGCWGNPPADYVDILRQQQLEIAELRKKFTVIEISCDRGDVPLESIS